MQPEVGAEAEEEEAGRGAQDEETEAAAADDDDVEDIGEDSAGEEGEGDGDEDEEARVEAEAGPSNPNAANPTMGKQKGPKTLPRKGGPHTIAAALRASRKPGTSQLPTARVKKIILSDPDVDACGKEATFAIGKACVRAREPQALFVLRNGSS